MLRGGYDLDRRPPSSAGAGEVESVTLYNLGVKMRLSESVGTLRKAPIRSIHLLFNFASRLTEGQPPSSSLSPLISGEVFVSRVRDRSLNASSKGQESGKYMFTSLLSFDTVLQGRRCDNSKDEKKEIDDTAERLLSVAVAEIRFEVRT
jgi:hypothetical protein